MENYIVIVPAAAAAPAAGDYRIIAEPQVLDENYKKVFGPDTKENCQKWITEKRATPAAPIVAPPDPPAPPIEPPVEPEHARQKGFMSYVTTGWTSYALIIVGMFGLMLFTVYVGGRSIRIKADELTTQMKAKTTDCLAMTSDAQKAFINEQRVEIATAAESHRITAIEFYRYFYSTFMVFSLFGLIAAISLAVIVRKGIDEASPHMITVFLISTGIVLTYQGFFGVFQQKNNIENNAKLFVSYAQLNTRIDTYCATGSLPMTDPKVLLAKSLSRSTDATPSPTPKQSNTNTGANTNSSANSNTQTNSNTGNPSGRTAPPETFSVALSPNDFINYVGWQMEQLKAISIAIDDKQIVAIDSSRLALTKP